MEEEVAVHTSEGSPAAQSALAALAAALNINENALKTALNGAFDLLPTAVGDPVLALRLSFQWLSYHIDNRSLSDTVSAFQQVFGAALGVEEVSYSPAWANCSQAHGLPRALGVCMGPSRYSAPGSRTSGEPIGQQHKVLVAAHYQVQNYPLPWDSGYDNAQWKA